MHVYKDIFDKQSPSALSARKVAICDVSIGFVSCTNFILLHPLPTLNRIIQNWAYIPEKDSILPSRAISWILLVPATFAPTGITPPQESSLQWSILSSSIPSLSTSSLTFWPPHSPTREENLPRASGYSAKLCSLSTLFCALSFA